MDIKNTISYDSSYSKSSSSETRIKQDIPRIDNNSNIQAGRIDRLAISDSRESLEDIFSSIDSTNKKLEVFDRKLEISIHEKTREVMVKVIDTLTDEIIRELPPEKVLDNLASRREFIGLLLDRKI